MLGKVLMVLGLGVAFLTVYFWAFIFCRDEIRKIICERMDVGWTEANTYSSSICIVLSGLEFAAIGRWLL